MESTQNQIEYGLPIILRRTLMTSGDSVTVAIPTEWLKQNELKKGDEIILIANGKITISKETPELIRDLSNSITTNSQMIPRQ